METKEFVVIFSFPNKPFLSSTFFFVRGVIDCKCFPEWDL